MVTKTPLQPSVIDKVPFVQKLAWGSGGFADWFMANTIIHLVMPIYNIGLGVDAVLIGLAMGLPRILDAVTDPLMGNISDNTFALGAPATLYLYRRHLEWNYLCIHLDNTR